MRLAVLCSPDSWYFRDLARAKGSHQLTTLAFSQIDSGIDTAGIHFPIFDEVDAVLVRTMPSGSLEQVVFRMDCLAQLQASGLPVVNSPRAVEVAVDKFLCSALLKRGGLDVPRTLVCQTEEDALQAFSRLGGDVVVKPLFGGEGRGITRINDEALMLRAAKLLIPLGAVVYLQEFVPHEGCDLRVLVLGDRVFGIRRRNPQDWRTNVSRGATAEPLEVSAPLADVARRAAAATGAEFAGVDVLPASDGRQLVLEVNAVPGWKALAHTLNIDMAAEVWRHLEQHQRGSR